MVHRKGLHRKRRVWLELSHDFISSYPSAHEEDRIRPWRSIMRMWYTLYMRRHAESLFHLLFLVTSVLEVLKEDPQHPRILRSRLDGKSGIKDCYLELDTVESARDWRREVQGEHDVLQNTL